MSFGNSNQCLPSFHSNVGSVHQQSDTTTRVFLSVVRFSAQVGGAVASGLWPLVSVRNQPSRAKRASWQWQIRPDRLRRFRPVRVCSQGSMMIVSDPCVNTQVHVSSCGCDRCESFVQKHVLVSARPDPPHIHSPDYPHTRAHPPNPTPARMHAHMHIIIIIIII